MERLVVEILAPDGSVRSRHRPALPFEIGRGYGCDVIVDDPYVCARHVRVEEGEAGPVVIDVSRVNGVVVREGEPVDRMPLREELVVSLGKTRCRLRAPGFQVAEALPLGPEAFRVPAWRRWCAASLGILALQAVSGWQLSLTTAMRLSFSDLLPMIVGVSIALAMWSGVWAFASRALGGRSRFAEHLAIASCGAIAMIGAKEVVEWLTYWAARDTPPTLLVALAHSVVFLLVLRAHLAIASRAGARALWLAASCAGSSILLLALVSHFASQDDFRSFPVYASDLKPLPVRWLPARAMDEAFQLDELRRELDAEAAEKRP